MKMKGFQQQKMYFLILLHSNSKFRSKFMFLENILLLQGSLSIKCFAEKIFVAGIFKVELVTVKHYQSSLNPIRFFCRVKK